MEEARMNPAVLVLAVLFAVAGFQEARRFERQYGQTPWRWDPWVWAVVMFLSWVIGVVLLAIAERQGRNRAAKQPAYASGYGQQPNVQYGFAQPGYGPSAGQPAVATASAVSGFGITEPAAVTAQPAQPAQAAAQPVAQSVAQPVAQPASLPAAMWSADPTGRHQYRWWDGATWTANVSTNGVTGQDPL